MTVEQILFDMWKEGVKSPVLALGSLKQILLAKNRMGVQVLGDIPDLTKIQDLFRAFED